MSKNTQSTDEQFNKAAQDVKNLKSRPTDGELLEIYALFKQGTVGDCNTTRPGILDLKGKSKWDAWNGKKGMSQNEAKLAYIARVKQLIDTYGMK
ncbi:acyl-CoA-binding protein-like protein [Leptotrombidium deliense]|uniref:Acyl-CoA-binding protein-like protein n=1 Tax=Leptotrombidium deliense TaxID=299467 RepID=A0A443STN5_9ACAR|nr:acyl-CoA-binding protein-like protein [Leptotrombidium deliense]